MNKFVVLAAVLVAATAAPQQQYQQRPAGQQQYPAQGAQQQQYNNQQGAQANANYGKPSGANYDQQQQMPMPYKFSYAVKDEPTGNDYAHQAESDGNVVTGSYRVLLPDGRTQIVTYRADENGYTADVRYEGEAKPWVPANNGNSYGSNGSNGNSYGSNGSNGNGNRQQSYSSAGSSSGANNGYSNGPSNNNAYPKF